MESYFWVAFVASLAAALVTTAGILVIRRFEDWGNRNSTYFACFAAGVLISVSLLHLAPISFGMAGLAPAGLLGGYWLLYLFNRFITIQVCDRPDRAGYAIGLVPMLGIGFHSLIDGTIYSVTFTVSVFTGALSAIGMVLHEFPEGIVTYVLLLRAGFTTRQSTFLAFVAAAVTTPLGMLASYPLVADLSANMLGLLLSLSGGALLYVGATHLLPRTEREPRHHSALAVTAGIAVAIVIVLSQ